jgi:hypothetical protein
MGKDKCVSKIIIEVCSDIDVVKLNVAGSKEGEVIIEGGGKSAPIKFRIPWLCHKDIFEDFIERTDEGL